MDPVSDLQRRVALARQGTPIYDYETVLNGQTLCRVYIGDRTVAVLGSGSKKKCRREVASKALYDLFGVFSAIYIGDHDPHWPYVRFIRRSEVGRDEVTQLLVDSDCLVYAEQPTTLSSSRRVRIRPANSVPALFGARKADALPGPFEP